MRSDTASFFENANDVIFLHDLKRKILAVNRAAESMTGYSRAEVLGKSFDELVAPEARHLTQDSIRRQLGGSAAQHLSCRCFPSLVRAVIWR